MDSPAPQLGGEDEEDVLRRQFAHLLALAGAALVGAPVPGVGKLLAGPKMPRPISDVPSRIGRADVEVVRELTRAVADVARSVGGQAGAATSLAGWADQLLRACASDKAREALLSALADLHVIAAWACHDSYAPGLAFQHSSQAVGMATEAKDSYRVSYALRHTAMMLIDRGRPNNALKLVQLAELHPTDVPGDDPRVAPLGSWLAGHRRPGSGRNGRRGQRSRGASGQERSGSRPGRLDSSEFAWACRLRSGPLADFLEGFKSVDLRELARRARQAAATRA